MDDATRVLSDAMLLDPRERARVARKLIASLDGDDSDREVERSWREEIRRRIDAVEDGTAELESWADVRARVSASIAK